MDIDIVERMRDRIECMRVRPLLQSFLDGELDEAQRRRVAVHLEACRRCGLEVSTYRSLKRRLGALGQPVDRDAVARSIEFVDRLVRDHGAEGDEAREGG